MIGKFEDIEEDFDLPGVEEEAVEEEPEESEEPKPGFWDKFKFWKKPKVKREKIRVTTERDLGIHNFDNIFRVTDDGMLEKVLKGDYFPVGNEFLIAEKEHKDRSESEWILYRKKLNKRAGSEQVTEHFRVRIQQIKRTILMIRDWDNEEIEYEPEGSSGEETDPGGEETKEA